MYPEQFDALLSNGSAKGGIVAAFDEVPYIKLILSQYCNKYTITPALKTAGFGFVSCILLKLVDLPYLNISILYAFCFCLWFVGVS